MTVPRRVTLDALPAGVRGELESTIAAAVPVVAPAVAVAVWQGGRPVFEGAFGRLEPRPEALSASPATRFDLASLTKLFTMTVCLALVGEGQVALDEALVRVIPELGERVPRRVDGGQEPLTRRMLPTPAERVGWSVDPSSVTIRHLLAHTSGLAPWRAVFEVSGPVPPPPHEPDPVPAESRVTAGMAAICASAFVDRPGRAIHYSDLGFMLLGEVVSRLAGRPLDEAVRERVTSPLGLSSVTYLPIRSGLREVDVAPTSVDRLWRRRRCWAEVEDENASGLGGVAGHAGLFASVGDVARFGEAWLEQDPRLRLAPDLLAEALAEQAREPGDRRGLGWELRPDPVSPGSDHLLAALSPSSFGHTGFTGTSLVVDPELGLVIACITNRVHAGRANPGIEELRSAVHTLLAAWAGPRVVGRLGPVKWA